MDTLIKKWNAALKELIQLHRMRLLTQGYAEDASRLCEYHIMQATTERLHVWNGEKEIILLKGSEIFYYEAFPEAAKHHIHIFFIHFFEQAELLDYPLLFEKLDALIELTETPIFRISPINTNQYSVEHDDFIVVNENEREKLTERFVQSDLGYTWFDVALLSQLTGCSVEKLKQHGQINDKGDVIGEFDGEWLGALITKTCGMSTFSRVLADEYGYATLLNPMTEIEHKANDFYVY